MSEEQDISAKLRKEVKWKSEAIAALEERVVSLVAEWAEIQKSFETKLAELGHTMPLPERTRISDEPLESMRHLFASEREGEERLPSTCSMM